MTIKTTDSSEIINDFFLSNNIICGDEIKLFSKYIDLNIEFRKSFFLPTSCIQFNSNNNSLSFFDDSIKSLTGYNKEVFFNDGLKKILNIIVYRDIIKLIEARNNILQYIKTFKIMGLVNDININFQCEISTANDLNKYVLISMSDFIVSEDNHFKSFVKMIDLTQISNKFDFKAYSFSRNKNIKIIDFYMNPNLETNGYALTEREYELLLLFSKGKSNKDVAKMLGISDRTVGAHKSNIFKKLKVKSTLEAITLFNKNRY